MLQMALWPNSQSISFSPLCLEASSVVGLAAALNLQHSPHLSLVKSAKYKHNILLFTTILRFTLSAICMNISDMNVHKCTHMYQSRM